MLRNIISKEMLRFNVHTLIFKYSRSDECNQTTRSNSLVVWFLPSELQAVGYFRNMLNQLITYLLVNVVCIMFLNRRHCAYDEYIYQ